MKMKAGNKRTITFIFHLVTRQYNKLVKYAIAVAWVIVLVILFFVCMGML